MTEQRLLARFIAERERRFAMLLLFLAIIAIVTTGVLMKKLLWDESDGETHTELGIILFILKLFTPFLVALAFTGVIPGWESYIRLLAMSFIGVVLSLLLRQFLHRKVGPWKVFLKSLYPK